MFREASLKLTAWYLAILMLISLFFSAALYEVATREVGNGLRPIPMMQSQDNGGVFSDDIFSSLRSQRIQDAENRILTDLIYFNIVILLAGGAISYLLARRTLRPIEEAHESQSRFAADASHELRTPLAAMRSEIEVALRAKTISAGDTKELLESNLEEVNKLTILSDSLLKLARYQNGMPEKSIVAVELDKVINEAIKNVKKIADSKEISFNVEADNISVAGDKSMLNELIVILLDNAIKYSPEHTTINIIAKKSDKEINISIKDEGIGISDKDLPHIFDRFYRADSSRGETKGYGIGLSLANEIVKIHKGKIAISSELEKGTEVIVTLPVSS